MLGTADQQHGAEMGSPPADPVGSCGMGRSLESETGPIRRSEGGRMSLTQLRIGKLPAYRAAHGRSRWIHASSQDQSGRNGAGHFISHPVALMPDRLTAHPKNSDIIGLFDGSDHHEPRLKIQGIEKFGFLNQRALALSQVIRSRHFSAYRPTD
jgi:hypothetical protein